MATEITALPKLFIGIDIHKKNWSIHIRSDISDHKSFTVPADPVVVYDYIDRNFPDHEVSLTYEAGCCGFSAARYFLQLGWEVTVVNPADVPTSNKQYYQKTDTLDCRNLSRQLALGELKAIHIPTDAEDELKSLLHHRAAVTRQLRAAKTHIKSYLLYQGVKIPQEHDNVNWTKAFISWLKDIEWNTVTGRMWRLLPRYQLTIKRPFPSCYPTKPQTIGEHIRKRRMDLRLSQRKAANLLSVHKESIIGWELGRSIPQITYFPRITNFLGHSLWNFDTSTLGGKILDYRHKEGLNADQFGVLVGVLGITVRNWELGKFKPYGKIVVKLNEVLEKTKPLN